jgi:hypothetical protein
MSETFRESFDAMDWAKEFVRTVKKHPHIATDEGTMLGWFANAIMRGFDEANSRIERIEEIKTVYNAEESHVDGLRAVYQYGADTNKVKDHICPEFDHDVLNEVAKERIRQDKKWGGPDHDDQHTLADWWMFRKVREDDIFSRPWPLEDHAKIRKNLIEIAALAVAQIEVLDRNEHAFGCGTFSALNRK